MRRNLWIRAVLLAAVGTAAAAARPAVHGAGPAPAPPPSTDAYKAALLGSDTPSGRREEAARRLVAGGTPADADAVTEALLHGVPAAQVAAAHAVAGSTERSAAWLGPLTRLLGPPRVTEAAAAALANYAGTSQADAAFDALRQFATSPGVPSLTRALAVRPMGAFSTQRAAAALMDALDDRSQTVQQAATSGLIEMTGEVDRGNVPANWQAWWAVHRVDTTAGWQAYALAARDRAAGPSRVHERQLEEDVTQVMESDYYDLPNASRKGHLDAYMRFASAAVRAEGAKLVLAEVSRGNRQVVEGALPRVRELIGDEDPAVRLAAVAAVQGAVDQQAGPALVAQLGREPDAAIRVRLTAALEKLQDLDAVGTLVKLLKDPRPAVAMAAAKALAAMGPLLRQQRPIEADGAANALRQLLAQRPPAGPGADEFRAACVAALAGVAGPQAFDTLHGLLDDPQRQESALVRAAALAGFGTLADTKADEIVADGLNDRDPTVRYAAARALQTVGTTQEAEQLFRLLNPREESDPDVRNAAWQSLEHLLDTGNVDFVSSFVGRFREDPVRRLAVQQEYVRALRAAKQFDGVAANDQEVAATLMELKRPEAAIAPLDEAIDIYQKNAAAGGGGDLENLVGQKLNAQLKAHQYAGAAEFASREIAQSASYQPTAGLAFRNVAEELKNANAPADLDALISAASSIQPPLEPRFIEHLKEIREDLRSSRP